MFRFFLTKQCFQVPTGRRSTCSATLEQGVAREVGESVGGEVIVQVVGEGVVEVLGEGGARVFGEVVFGEGDARGVGGGL